MSDHEPNPFREAMQGIVPLKDGDDRVPHAKRTAPTLAENARREAASADPETDNNPLSDRCDISLCDPHDICGSRKNGVQKGVYRKLRLGKYAVQASLDLHRLTLADARLHVHQFLETAYQQGHRTILIIHGKGERAIMKSYTWHWLEQHPLVLAWHSATPRLGGAGATLAMVRKRQIPPPAK